MAAAAEFISDVDAYMAGQSFETKILELQEALRGFKQREQALLMRKARLSQRAPEIRAALEAVQALLAQRDAGGAADVDFELTEGIFARAALRDVGSVNLWLGANVMVEYGLDEAAALLSANLESCKASLADADADLVSVKDSATITEVSMARVFNWDTARRALAPSAFRRPARAMAGACGQCVALPGDAFAAAAHGACGGDARSLIAAAALLRKRGGLAAAADPLAAGSRSGSPYLGPADANNATGALDGVAAMTLGPAAAAPPGAACCGGQPGTPAARHHQLSGAGCDSSQCSHSSARTGGQEAAGAPAPSAPAAPAAAPAPAPPAALPAPAVPPGTAGSPKSWLYQLVSCPYLFKPCSRCAPSHSGREALITFFDPDAPAAGFCSYCPARAGRPRLLQIRRSTYHEVVKAADVSRLADVGGVQHYVINGAKVRRSGRGGAGLCRARPAPCRRSAAAHSRARAARARQVVFLRPRPQPRPPKGAAAPARCAVDGRQLMDGHASYCSLRCKLEVEDALFAAHYPTAAEEAEAAAAAAAEGGPAADARGAGLAGTFHRQGGHEGRRVVVPGHKRAAPATPPPDACGGGADDASSEEGDAEAKPRHKRARTLPSKFANAVLGGGSATFQAASGGGGAPPHGPAHRAGGGGQHAGRAGAHHQAHRADDTASDQAAGSLSFGGGGAARASPCASEDSARSSTCNQRWHHKRKVVHPCRAPLQ
ncbi:prefoldin subunit 3 [Scenedesmus sp. PABB004]|nr:prefoldin subunit 3 [Scenedesmus sp. PABB004]